VLDLAFRHELEGPDQKGWSATASEAGELIIQLPDGSRERVPVLPGDRLQSRGNELHLIRRPADDAAERPSAKG
jgi:hypothetical protein